MATPTAAPSDRIEEHDGDVTYIRTDKDLPPVAIIDRSPITTRHKVIFGIIALLGAIAWAVIAFFRGETVNAVWFVIAAICTYVIGFRFYARLIETEDRPPARRPRDTGRSVRERHRLHADRPAGAVRPSLRRDRGRGSAGRSGACHADGLSAGHHLDHHRRGIRRMCAGLPRAVDLHPTTGPLAGSDGPRRTRRRRRRGRHHRDHHDHDDPAGGAGAGGGAGARGEPVGCLLDRDDHPDCALHGRLFAAPASRSGVRGICDRRCAAAAGRRSGRLGSRNILGCFMVRPVRGDDRMVSDHLRLRRLGATRVVAARAARLPVDVHEGRHHRAARDRHPDRPPGHAGTRCLRVRQQRPGSSVRRLVVPVPVHHDRVRCAVRLPLTDRLRHHAENAGERKPDEADRLRRHDDRIVRRHHSADHRGDPEPAPVLHAQRTRGADRQYRGDGRRVRQQSAAHRRPNHRRADRPKPPRTSARNPSSPAPAARPRWRSACRKCCTACSAVPA